MFLAGLSHGLQAIVKREGVCASLLPTLLDIFFPPLIVPIVSRTCMAREVA